MPKKYGKVEDAIYDDSLAAGEVIEIAGRPARVVFVGVAKTVKFLVSLPFTTVRTVDRIVRTARGHGRLDE